MPLADIVLSFYLGASQTQPSDLRLVQPSAGDDATIRNVTWRGYPFRFEIYYGVRLAYSPRAGFASIVLDYTHAKVYADTDAVVAQDGEWHNSPLHAQAPMRERVQSFEMTHGMNILGVNVMQQLNGRNGNGVYVGGGPVVFLPHTESRVNNEPFMTGYAYGGGGFQVVAGVRGCLARRKVFIETKYSRAAPRIQVARGWAQTLIRTVHELAGTNFGPRC